MFRFIDFPSSRFDMIIGGISAQTKNSSRQIDAIEYGSDQLTWCVRRAGFIPRWMNIIKIVKDYEVYLVCFFGFYFVVLVMYVLSGHDKLNWDAYQTMMKALQIIFQSSAVIKNNLTLPMMMFLGIGILSAMVLLTTMISIYISIVQIRFKRYQINTRTELMDEGYQLAGDPAVLPLMRESEMVSVESELSM